ncbi:MAG TPA: PAS domain S-box protein [Verrucomicrobiae bacterium]|nr:PAS domain S-box protein [Verrucomicrobiae bacterium]
MENEFLKILLIDSQPGFAGQLRDMLGQAKGASFELMFFNRFEEGLARLAEGGIDLALIELCLPDGAGLANVQRAQAQDIRVPIIVLGDADDETVAIGAVHAGAQDYLVKSQLNPQLLGRAIRYAIERQRADAALLEAEEKYRGIFENIVEGIFQTSPDGRYLSANAALARIYGYTSPQELIESVRDIGRKLYVEQGRRAEFVQLMQQHDTVTDFESRIFRKDGTIIWIAENVRAIRNEKNELLYYEGTVEDITQRQMAEEKLRESEALYHSLVENLPQNIFRKDLQGKFTFVNQRFCNTIGRTAAEIIGKTDFDLFPDELATKYQKDDRRILEKNKMFETVEQHQPPGGEMIYVQVVKTPLYDSQGKMIGLQGIFWDISERKRAEEQIRLATAELARSREALRKKNEQMEEDLKMAREIQQTMLPQQYPSFPKSAAPGHSRFRFSHRYLPTGTVGGDYFNVMALSDSQAGVFICDVMGHGVRSALVAAMVRALVEELKPLGSDPGKLLTQLNRDLCSILKHTGSPTLTTAFYLTADATTGLLRYANAGHPRPFLIHRGTNTTELLTNGQGKKNPALGLFEDAAYATAQSPISEGDLVMMFTDGLYEVEGKEQTLYTSEMLADAVRRRARLPAGELFDEVLAEIKEFALGQDFVDDVCLVGMEFSEGK